jgi:hypothetical protein
MWTPIVVLVRNQIGTAKFNQIRGQAIALHCQAITNFCNWAGINPKERQNLIRVAKSNGKLMGLLA